MVFKLFMILIGFALLVLGADLLVRGSSNIARKFHIPEMLIGLSIIALGTSAPEIIITINSASKGAGDLIIGNAVGSNLCNLLLILGLMAAIRPIKIEKEAKIIHIPISFLATLFVLLLGLGYLRKSKGNNKWNRRNFFISTWNNILFISYISRNKRYYKSL